MTQGTGKYNPDDEVSLSDFLPDLLGGGSKSATGSSAGQGVTSASPSAYPPPAPDSNSGEIVPPPLPMWAQFPVADSPAQPPAKMTPSALPYQPQPPAATPMPADYLLAEPEPLYPQPSEKKARKGFSLSTPAIVGLVASIFLVPALVFGFFFVLANIQPEARPLTAQELENTAKTPIPTIKPNSPGAGAKPNPTGGANSQPTPNAKPTLPPFEFKNDCGYKSTPGRIDAFPCSKPFSPDQPELKNLITISERQINDSGNKPLGSARYDYTSEGANRIQEFYAGSLRSMGYNQEGDSPSGNSQLGSYRVLYFTNGRQRIQVVMITVNSPVPNGSLAPGNILIRLSAN